MKQRNYSWRYRKGVADGLARDARRGEVLQALSTAGPRTTYCDCLEFAIRSGSQKATGYAAHLFREIFGAWPRPCDRGPPAPQPNPLIDEWVAGRKRKSSRNTVAALDEAAS